MALPEKKVSLVVIRRLPRYYRYLGELLAQDIKRISSKELSKKMNVTASQIRQDLNCFGGFGQQGYGYNVEYLYKEISQILGLDVGYSTIIIGCGHLGHALANHGGFERRRFHLVGLFDNNPAKIGQEISGVEITDTNLLEDFIAKTKVDIAILALPKEGILDISNRLVDCGIKGLWNFSAVDLEVQEKGKVAVENVHLSDSLMTLAYKIQEREHHKNLTEE